MASQQSRSRLVSGAVRDVKICLIGDTTVGKSSLLQRFMTQQFQEQDITIGAAFSSKMLTVDGMTMRLNVWDTAGQERFKSLVSMYCRNASAAIVVFDISKQASFANVADWIAMLSRHCELDSLTLALVGNKADLDSDRQVQSSEGTALAAQYGARAFYIETSARTGAQVNELFEEIATRLARTLAAAEQSLSLNSSHAAPAGGPSGEHGQRGRGVRLNNSSRARAPDAMDGEEEGRSTRSKCCKG